MGSIFVLAFCRAKLNVFLVLLPLLGVHESNVPLYFSPRSSLKTFIDYGTSIRLRRHAPPWQVSLFETNSPILSPTNKLQSRAYVLYAVMVNCFEYIFLNSHIHEVRCPESSQRRCHNLRLLSRTSATIHFLMKCNRYTARLFRFAREMAKELRSRGELPLLSLFLDSSIRSKTPSLSRLPIKHHPW